jgi:hypothetical protein
MRIRWTPPDAAENISDHLKDHHPQYRQPTMRRLYERIQVRLVPFTPEANLV